MNDATLINKTADDATTAAITPLKGLLVLAGVIVVISGYIALNRELGIANFWVAFLFLLYWTGVEHMKFAKLPHCIVGALVGLLLGYLMQTLPNIFGATGGLIFLGVVVLIIYGQIMGWLSIAINGMTMLFLTVTTLPALQTSVNLGSLVAALALGVAYFGGLIALGSAIKQRIANRKQMTPAALI